MGLTPILNGAHFGNLAKVHGISTRPSRQQMNGNLNNQSRSCCRSSLDNIVSSTESVRNGNVNTGFNNYLAVHNLPIITTERVDTVSIKSEQNTNDVVIDIDNDTDKDKDDHTSFTTMTPQEIAMSIDRFSRFVFPLVFLAFNAIYWIFVCCF